MRLVRTGYILIPGCWGLNTRCSESQEAQLGCSYTTEGSIILMASESSQLAAFCIVSSRTMPMVHTAHCSIMKPPVKTPHDKESSPERRKGQIPECSLACWIQPCLKTSTPGILNYLRKNQSIIHIGVGGISYTTKDPT